MGKRYFLNMGDDHRLAKNKLQEEVRNYFYRHFNHRLTSDVKKTIEQMKEAVETANDCHKRSKALTTHFSITSNGGKNSRITFYVPGLFVVSILQVKEVSND